MNYKQSSIDIIGNIISSLTFPVTILDYTNNGAGVHTLSVDNMYHAQVGFEITIGGRKYVITEISYGESDSCGTCTKDSMLIKGDSGTITTKTFNMYPPFFFYGTPMAEGTELSQVNQAKNKTPMFWLRLDDFSETFYEDARIRKEREIKFRLYALSQSDHEKWVTSEAINQVVNPMKRMAEKFVSKILAMPERFDKDNLEWSIPAVYPKFGVISINRGVEKSLWADKLGGIEINMTLTVFKQTNCCP